MSADVKAIEAALACFPAERVAGYDEARCDLAHCCTPERMRRLLDEREELIAALRAEQEWRDRERDGAIDPEWDYEFLVGSQRRAVLAKAGGEHD